MTNTYTTFLHSSTADEKRREINRAARYLRAVVVELPADDHHTGFSIKLWTYKNQEDGYYTRAKEISQMG